MSAGRWAARAGALVGGGRLGLWGFAGWEAQGLWAELAGAVAAAEEACGTVAREIARSPRRRELQEKARRLEKELEGGRKALALADEQVARARSCLNPFASK